LPARQSKAPNSKHQASNNIQYRMTEISRIETFLGHWYLVIGYCLEFGLPARSRFGEGRDLAIGI
jgi:hypothetical protein